MPSRNTARGLFARKIWIVGILVISIIWGVKAQKAQVSSCQLFMCTKSDNTIAIASIAEPGHVVGAQNFIAGQCPGETNVIKCNIDCDGPYNSYVSLAYWTWKKCVDSFYDGIYDYICDDASVMQVCNLGYDPDYPFNE